jgi:hypothetical protein
LSQKDLRGQYQKDATKKNVSLFHSRRGLLFKRTKYGPFRPMPQFTGIYQEGAAEASGNPGLLQYLYGIEKVAV